MRLVQVALILLAPLVVFAAEEGGGITIYGSTGTSAGSAAGLTAYLAGGAAPQAPIAGEPTDDRSGQWIAQVERPGVYTAAVEEAYGFGPALRTGVTIEPRRFNRVEITLPYQCELVQAGQPNAQEHAEFGQTFVAAGTAVTGIAFKDAAQVMITLHDAADPGRQIGPAVRAGGYYPVETLPTVPGQKYLLRFTRKDHAPFRMHVVKGNPYPDGTAVIDGKNQSAVDLALRIQYNPVGQILRHKPGFGQVYRPAVKSYGQTFVARGTSLAMLSVFPASGEDPPSRPVIRLLESGPEGRPVCAPIASRVLVFNPGQVPLSSGSRYYIEVTFPGFSGGPRLWTSKEDDFGDGELHVDGQPVPGRDLSMILVEHDTDTLAPPAPTAPDWHPGLSAYARRFPADGRARMVWDVPADADISRLIVRRFDGTGGGEQAAGIVVSEMPATSSGRYHYSDAGIVNDVSYRYTIQTVDSSGNESKPLVASVVPRPGLPLAAELLNGDFAGPADAGLPYGWMTRTLAGSVPAFRREPADGDRNPVAAAGWEILEGNDSTDTVLFQQVPCEQGRRYRLIAQARLWNPWNTRQMIICATAGIDPTGGDDPSSEAVVWGSPTFERQNWIPLSASAVAQSDCITVYLRGYSHYSRFMNTRFRGTRLIDVTHSE
ncbi:MAG: hypothetical protein AMXMBFR13_01620 [Phycisphaerae bacterium]